MPFFNLSLLLALFGLAACADQADRAPAEAGTASSTSEAAIPYRVDAPDAVIVHSEVLEEASALTVLPNGHLATLHDEEGVIFEIDPATGDIVNETAFEGPGDFEGLEWVDGVFWALRSDGTLFRVAEGEPMQVFQTHLTEDSDTEGLGWDPTTGRLLIACKEDPGGGLQGVRAVYAFDPDQFVMDAFPAVMLQRDKIDAAEEFRPSAIAVHPVSGETYVLSARRRSIAVVYATGALTSVVDLPPAANAQPEGIAFLPDGTMFIQNEAGEGPASTQRFSMVAE